MFEEESGVSHKLNFVLPTKEQTRKVREDWTKFWIEHKGEILEKDEMEKRLLEKSDPNRISEQQAVPGIYEFDSPQVLYVVYSSFFGEDSARREVSHEVEHHKVYEKHRVPCGFGIALSRVGENGIWGVGLLTPHFPEDFDEAKRKAIMNEANLIVAHPSLRDIEAVKKFESTSG